MACGTKTFLNEPMGIMTPVLVLLPKTFMALIDKTSVLLSIEGISNTVECVVGGKLEEKYSLSFTRTVM